MEAIAKAMYEFPLYRYKDDGIRPARAQLQRVQAAVGAETDPILAWKKLVRVGLVPLIHAQSPERIFRHISQQPLAADSRAGGRLISNLDGGPPAAQHWFVTDRPEPFSIEDAVLISADATGIEQAEEAARTLCQRLQIFGQALPRRMVWRVMSSTEPTWRPGGKNVLDDIEVFLSEAFDRAGHQLSSHPQTGLRPSGYEMWKLAAVHGYQFPSEIEDPYCTFADGPPPVPQAVIGKPIRDLPNPFEQLNSLARLGYRLDSLTNDEVVLLAPPR